MFPRARQACPSEGPAPPRPSPHAGREIAFPPRAGGCKGGCQVRRLSEGRARRVRRIPFDNPFRFRGHDERAPPTSAAPLRSSRHLCKSAGRTDLALTYEFPCAQDICQNLLAIVITSADKRKHYGSNSGNLVTDVDPQRRRTITFGKPQSLVGDKVDKWPTVAPAAEILAHDPHDIVRPCG